jgi:transketolase
MHHHITRRLTAMDEKLLQLTANTIRVLAMEGVQKANSGHPGMPMGTADLASVLWHHYLHFNPEDPAWPNRDRFVLSAGHGSMLLYSLLHLFGFQVTMDDLKSFRQWESRTPGHPERGCLPGVECTTGPLGQGFGMGVGMALACKMLAARFNREGFPIFDSRVFAIAGDGCMMEGVTAEAASLAGHLALDNLVYIYDYNRITIEGCTDLAYSDDVEKRFEGYHWAVHRVDGHNIGEIFDVLGKVLQQKGKPQLIIATTHIAQGSPHKHDQSESHGSPLGPDEVAATKQNLGWPASPDFHIPAEVKEFCGGRVDEAKKQYDSWTDLYARWRAQYPELAAELDIYTEKKIPESLADELAASIPAKDMATRASSGEALKIIGKAAPFLIGGAADLEPSIKCHVKGAPSLLPGHFEGRNIHFGIREHGMGAIINGMALFGGIIPYGATFLVFSDYMRPAIRLAAMMKLQVVYVFSHDSIFLGEDGPTHQPVEHLASLRIIPGLTVIRPADAMETSFAWLQALKRKNGPTALVLTRQNVPLLKRPEGFNHGLLEKGGYILSDSSKPMPDIVMIATGSEVHVTDRAASLLREQGIDARVVSMPSLEIFEEQSEEYKSSVIPDGCRHMVAVEASHTRDWDRYLKGGLFIGLSTFGHSAPSNVLADKLGFTPEKIAGQVAAWYAGVEGEKSRVS